MHDSSGSDHLISWTLFSRACRADQVFNAMLTISSGVNKPLDLQAARPSENGAIADKKGCTHAVYRSYSTGWEVMRVTVASTEVGERMQHRGRHQTRL